MQNRRFEIALSALLFGSSAVFSAACGSSAQDAAPAGLGGAKSGDGGADDGGSEPFPRTLEFVPTDSLELDPKESRRLTVQTTPAGPFRIRFGFKGDGAADAVLDSSEVETDADGFARVTLIAPSQPSTFDVRASCTQNAQTQLSVSVRAKHVTTLRVRPSYSGPRNVTEWTATASARAGASCNELAGNPPPDGERSRTANFDAPLEIDDVPVGVDLVVTVRAGHYIGGCVKLPALSEGEGNQVLVYASDRPLNLSATHLSLSLGATDAHPEFDKLLQASAGAAQNALLGGAKNDVAALLEGMRDSTPAANREAFDLARMQSAWDGALDSAFGKSAARRMRDPVQRWMSAGLLALDAPDALVGQLRARGSGVTFTPSRVGTATPSSAGLTDVFEGTWSADSNDTVLLGMDLNWEPSRLVTALAVAPAVLEYPEATSAELALALSVDCAQVGQVLVAKGVTPGSVAFSSCDATCATSLCNLAVASAWSKAKVSSGAELATLSVTATAAAEVGDDAEAVSLAGSWVGQLRTDSGVAQVSGALSAQHSAP